MSREPGGSTSYWERYDNPRLTEQCVPSRGNDEPGPEKSVNQPGGPDEDIVAYGGLDVSDDGYNS